ncbi:MAG: VUT family protein [Actinomycetota bacterium]|nr:VUT family protein [Actinomycetota bacterium]
MRLAVLTGLYVGVVCAAQIGAQKIVVVPGTNLSAPGGTYLIGLALALIEVAHHTAPTRRAAWLNAQVMIGCGFAASALLAGYIAIVDASRAAFPGQAFGELADTWRIVLASLAAFAVSETTDNVIGAWLRGRAADPVRVVATNAVSAPLDSIVFLAIAFASLEFLEGQIVAKLGATLVLGVPLVVAARRVFAATRVHADGASAQTTPRETPGAR